MAAVAHQAARMAGAALAIQPLDSMPLVRVIGPPIYRTFHHHRPDRGEETTMSRLTMLSALGPANTDDPGPVDLEADPFEPSEADHQPPRQRLSARSFGVASLHMERRPVRLPPKRALAQACPACGSNPGELCHRRNGRARAPHRERYAAVGSLR